ncbi:MAG: hypothetical protein RM338_18665 [Nostoc sp. DedQUE12a]|nr:hypothetical protein [Nostoc sp. DedQUE12a]
MTETILGLRFWMKFILVLEPPGGTAKGLINLSKLVTVRRVAQLTVLPYTCCIEMRSATYSREQAIGNS